MVITNGNVFIAALSTLLLLMVTSPVRANPAEMPALNQKLLVISFDAFRYQYLQDNHRFLPWLNQFRSEGVYSDQMESIFPSETFPNHWSIATGMYAENHGIVSNYMYDPSLNETFSKSNVDFKWWGEAEPIWISARKQSIKTAISFWPGSAVEFPDGLRPDYWSFYDESVRFETRINETIDHLAYDDVRLAMLYYNQPDETGHKFGVPSNYVDAQLQLVDWYLSFLFMKLDQVGLGKDKLNIIICADHGMVNKTDTFILNKYLDTDEYIERVNY